MGKIKERGENEARSWLDKPLGWGWFVMLILKMYDIMISFNSFMASVQELMKN